MDIDSLVCRINTLYDFSEIEYKNAFPGTVWHYTDNNGIKGIIRENSIVFWLTRSDCLADHTEGAVLEEVLQKAIEDMKHKYSFEPGFSRIIDGLHVPTDRSLFYRKNDGNVWHSTEPCDTYIACFCLSENSQEMWTEYTNEREGYSLEFDRNLFSEIFNFVNVQQGRGYVDLHLQRVLYDEDEQVQYLIKKIKQAYDVFSVACQSDSFLVADDFIAKSLQSILNQLRFSCKHKRYSFENEVRAVVYLPRDRGSLIINNPEIKNVGSKVVAELTLGRKNWLREISISPYVKTPDLAERTREWIQEMGYNIEVRKAKQYEA